MSKLMRLVAHVSRLSYLRTMTNLQWDTYRHRAEAFTLDYLHVRDEKGEAHS